MLSIQGVYKIIKRIIILQINYVTLCVTKRIGSAMLIMMYNNNYYVYNCRYDILTRPFYCSNMKYDNVCIEKLRDNHARLSNRNTQIPLSEYAFHYFN